MKKIIYMIIIYLKLIIKYKISGSCTYYSIFMSLYYISYICHQISQIPINSTDSFIIKNIKDNF